MEKLKVFIKVHEDTPDVIEFHEAYVFTKEQLEEVIRNGMIKAVESEQGYAGYDYSIINEYIKSLDLK